MLKCNLQRHLNKPVHEFSFSMSTIDIKAFNATATEQLKELEETGLAKYLFTQVFFRQRCTPLKKHRFLSRYLARRHSTCISIFIYVSSSLLIYRYKVSNTGWRFWFVWWKPICYQPYVNICKHYSVRNIYKIRRKPKMCASYSNSHLCPHIHTRIHPKHTHAWTLSRAHTHTHKRSREYMHTYMHMHMHMHASAYAHTYTHMVEYLSIFLK